MRSSISGGVVAHVNQLRVGVGVGKVEEPHIHVLAEQVEMMSPGWSVLALGRQTRSGIVQQVQEGKWKRMLENG